MTHSYVPQHAVEVAKTVAEGGFLTLVTIVAAITAMTVIYAWFFV